MKSVVCILSIFLIALSCKKDGHIEPVETLTFVSLEAPANFPEIQLNNSNPLSIEGIELGRKLYYDTILSSTGKSCSSCHLQTSSFTENTSNSQSHVNLIWNQYFLRNGQIEGTLEDAMMFEVESFFHTDISKLNQDPLYPKLFKKVFGKTEITSKEVAYALAQFLSTLISSNSKFDSYLKGQTMLNSSELNGLDIFLTERGDCFHCHSVGLMGDNSFHNIGLDLTFNSLNWGRYAVTMNEVDMGKFKTPSLRNVEFSGPYMHDGRFSSLEEVVEFYNSGVQVTAYTDPIMTKPGKEFGLQLSNQDKIDLVNFLKALTDTSFLNNTKFSKP